jgi:hypothetical protein
MTVVNYPKTLTTIPYNPSNLSLFLQPLSFFIDVKPNSLVLSKDSEWYNLYLIDKEGEPCIIPIDDIKKIAKRKRLKGSFKQYVNVKGDNIVYFYHPNLLEALAEELSVSVSQITLEVAMGRWYNNFIDCVDEEN